MTYLTIINPESNGDEPGERLMAPSARYTCSATKLWPNRRPRSPMSKINTAPSPVALGAVHGGDLQPRNYAHYVRYRWGGKAGRPSLPFLSQLAAPSLLTAAHLQLRGDADGATYSKARLSRSVLSSAQIHSEGEETGKVHIWEFCSTQVPYSRQLRREVSRTSRF